MKHLFELIASPIFQRLPVAPGSVAAEIAIVPLTRTRFSSAINVVLHELLVAFKVLVTHPHGAKFADLEIVASNAAIVDG